MALTVDLIRQELVAFQTFVANFAASGANLAHQAETKVSLVRSIVTKIGVCPNLDMSNAAILQTAAQGLHLCIEAQEMSMLQSAIVNRIRANTSTVAISRREPQSCLSADMYLKEGVWQFIEAEENTIPSCVMALLRAMHGIRLSNPNELTLKVLAAIILCAKGSADLPYEQKYDVYMQLKRVFQSQRLAPGPFQHYTLYPSRPHELEAGFYAAAYGEEPPAQEQRCYPITQVARSVPARTSNANLALTPIRPTRHSIGMGGANMAMLQQMMQEALNMQSPRAAEALPGLRVFGRGGSRSGGSAGRLQLRHDPLHVGDVGLHYTYMSTQA